VENETLSIKLLTLYQLYEKRLCNLGVQKEIKYTLKEIFLNIFHMLKNIVIRKASIQFLNKVLRAVIMNMKLYIKKC